MLQRLSGQRFGAHLPRIVVERANRTRRIEPLVRRYLSVEMDIGREPWGEVQRTPGAEALLSNEAGVPAALPVGSVAVASLRN